MLYFDLTSGQSHLIYLFFTTLALVVPFVFAWRIGLNKGFPAATWLTTLAVVNGLMIIGLRLGAFHADEWAALFHNGQWQSESPKTAVGGLLLAIVGFAVLKKWFKLPASAADAVMLGLPLGAAISRMGCLAAGCCYGIPSDGAWSVIYGPSSSAFDAQASCGMIPEGASASLPLHPVQLDLILANLLIFGVLWINRHKLRPGNLALTALMLMAISRFGSEFFRDAAANPGETGRIILGMKAVQWMSLLLVAVSMWFFRRNGQKIPAPRMAFREQPYLLLSLLVFPLSILLWVFRFRLGILETLVFLFSFAPAIAAIAVGIWKNEQKNWIKWSSAALLSGTVALQAVVQVDSLINPIKTTSEADTMKNNGLPSLPYEESRTWWELGTGYAHSRFRDYDATVTGSGCNSQSTVNRDRKIQQQTIGFEGSYHYLDKDNTHSSVTARLGLSDTEVLDGFPGTQGKLVFGGVSGNMDTRWVGIGMGVLVLPSDYNDFLGGKKTSLPVLLSGGVRLGLRTAYSFDIQLRERQQFLYYRYPNLSVGLFNWGFRDPTGQTWVRAGVAGVASSNQSGAGLFAAFRTPVWGRRMTVEGGYYGLGNGEKDYSLSFGVKYLLNGKNTK